MKKYLITGANGILAKEIILRADSNTQFIVLTHDLEKVKMKFGQNKSLVFYQWNYINQIPLDDVDAIIHCGFSRKEDGQSLQNSLLNTIYLLQKGGNEQIPFLCISSRSVYGQQKNIPWAESTPVDPENMYALAKCAQELLIEQAGRYTGFPYSNIRLAGLIGIGLDSRVVNKMIRSAVEHKCIQVLGGNQQFALLDVRDAADGILKLLNVHPAKWKSKYNLGIEYPYSLIQIAQTVAQVVEETLHTKIVIERQNMETSLIDQMDCRSFYLDTQWKPVYSLNDTIVNILASYFIE